MMTEGGLNVDHSTIARWVLRYALILEARIRRHLRRPNRSWRVDDTYVQVAGKWNYQYRAIDPAGDTIEFMLSPYRGKTGAKYFLQLALGRVGKVQPRVVNVDGHPAYGSVIAERRRSGELHRSCVCRPVPYLNNVIKQDHRFVNKRIVAS